VSVLDPKNPPATGFSGRVVFVTGAGAGIGRATALALAASGAAVSFLTRVESECRDTEEELQSMGVPVVAMTGDVSDPGNVEASVARTVGELGGLDAVVANAGIMIEPTSLSDARIDEWNAVLATNLSGAFFTAKYTFPPMLARGKGSIVIMGSDLSIYGWQGLFAYAASKHGLVGLTKSLALQYGPYGIRTNMVCPTIVRTPMLEAYEEKHPESVAAMVKSVPQGRMTTPEEVARVICHLLSDDAAFTNGLLYTVDGGLTAGIFDREAALG
jgi:NAD(P)-dependent dehydrogenase (short-subunit alcohol dehydrogenase family)